MATGTMLKPPSVLREARSKRTPGPKCIGEYPTGYFFVRCEGKNYNIALSGIRYIESRSNYCRVVTTERSYMVLATLKEFVDALPSPAFCQIHRAYVVGLSHVKCFDHRHIYFGEEQLTVGEHFAAALMATAPVFNRIKSRRKA
jgi:DNA-binding LytR/AlgR family response regulator